MTNLSDKEIASILAVGPRAGAHLEALGKTDLATMTEEEWMGFIEAVVMAYASEMAARHAPYAVLRSKDDPMVINGFHPAIQSSDAAIQSSEIPF